MSRRGGWAKLLRLAGTGRSGGGSGRRSPPLESTRTVPLRSRMSPRGAGIAMSRIAVAVLAWATYWSPDRTCRNQSRKKMIANITSAKPPSDRRRAAPAAASSAGGGRRGGWIIARIAGSARGAGRPLQRAEAAGGVGAPAPAARVVGQRRAGSARRTSAYTGSAISVLTSTVRKICCSSSRLTGASTPSRNWISGHPEPGDGGRRRAAAPAGRARARGRAAHAGARTSSRSRCTAARSPPASGPAPVSTNSPTPKPMIAPGIEPASSPTDITTSGVRSALTPKIEICETAASWMTTATNAEGDAAGAEADRVRSPAGTWAALGAGVRPGQDLDDARDGAGRRPAST